MQITKPYFGLFEKHWVEGISRSNKKHTDELLRLQDNFQKQLRQDFKANNIPNIGFQMVVSFKEGGWPFRKSRYCLLMADKDEHSKLLQELKNMKTLTDAQTQVIGGYRISVSSWTPLMAAQYIAALQEIQASAPNCTLITQFKKWMEPIRKVAEQTYN